MRKLVTIKRKKPQKFVSEAKRVLKPSGCIYAADPNFPTIVRQAANLVIPLLKMGYVKVYSRKELIEFFQEQDFRNVIVKRFGLSGYLLMGVN